MNFYEIITTVYADAWSKKQFLLCQHSVAEGVVIQSWGVPNVAQPTHAEVMAMETPTMDFSFAYNTFLTDYLEQLSALMDNVATQKSYDDTISCVSYLNSTNLTWKNEAVVFNAWRDSVWNYLYEQQVLILNKTRTIPAIDVLNAELPVIIWPI